MTSLTEVGPFNLVHALPTSKRKQTVGHHNLIAADYRHAIIFI